MPLQALQLGAAVGLGRRSLVGGAAYFMRSMLTCDCCGFPNLTPQPDSLLSTHPAMVNRLARLPAVGT